jgi:hypothetical protein
VIQTSDSETRTHRVAYSFATNAVLAAARGGDIVPCTPIASDSEIIRISIALVAGLLPMGGHSRGQTFAAPVSFRHRRDVRGKRRFVDKRVLGTRHRARRLACPDRGERRNVVVKRQQGGWAIVGRRDRIGRRTVRRRQERESYVC